MCVCHRGSTPQLPFSSEIERFTPISNTWSILRTRLPVGLANTQVFPLPSRPCFLVLGGYGEEAEGRDVCLINLQEGSVRTDLPKLKTPFTELSQFPVMFDSVSNVIHLLISGDGESCQVTHSYYNVDTLMRVIPESEVVNSPEVKNSRLITPSTKSNI